MTKIYIGRIIAVVLFLGLSLVVALGAGETVQTVSAPQTAPAPAAQSETGPVGRPAQDPAPSPSTAAAEQRESAHGEAAEGLTLAPDQKPAEKATQPPPPPEPARPSPATAQAEAAPRALPGAIGVMVENSWGARPQVGLDRADLVYESEAEYGITRFLALFHRQSAPRIGPVRSARMHFYDIAVAHRVPYAHAGGSVEVLAELKHRNTRLLNIDEIYTCGGCFWRSSDRKAPHNLYTSTDLLVNRSREAGFALSPLSLPPTGPAPGGGVAVGQISLHWGPRSEQVTWSWNGQRYQRSQSGAPHLLEGGVRVETDNLILIFTWFQWDGGLNDGNGAYRVGIIGKGSGVLYRGGQAYPIRWEKGAREEPYRLFLADGSPAALAEGKVWFTILKTQEHVTRGLPE